MEPINNIEEATEKVLSDMNAFIQSVRLQSTDDIIDLNDGLSRLRNIRSSVYENLNQIQHEYLILQGLIWLSHNNHVPDGTQWYWNPRQTGDSSEPDLRGILNGVIVVSAEATTSEKPQGVIDKRMKKTLDKLNDMDGSKYYFIRTSSMERRANTKVTNNMLQITVVKIEN